MAIIDIYDVGDLVRVTGTLTDLSGDLVDPTTLIATVEQPDGTELTFTYGTTLFPMRDSTGVYYIEYTPTMVGDHFVTFKSTGTGQAMDDARFVVREKASRR